MRRGSNDGPSGVSLGRRRVRFSDEKHTPIIGSPDSEGVEVESLRPLFELPEFPAFRLDFTTTPTRRIVRQLIGALREYVAIPGSCGSPGSVQGYGNAIRKIARYLNRVAPAAAQIEDVSELGADHLNCFEDWLRSHYHEFSTIPYQTMLCIVQLLRQVRDRGHPVLQQDLRDRLEFVANGPLGETTPRDAYSDFVSTQLRRACRRHIGEVVRRITVEGERLLQAGQDPRVAGWTSRANLLWEIAQGATLTKTDIELRTSRTFARENGITALLALLYPNQHDLFPFITLFALESGIPIECCKSLRIDCMSSPANGYMTVSYLKRRAHRRAWKQVRIRDGGSTTPGGILRMVLRLTRRLREIYPSERLWIHRTPWSVTNSKFLSNDGRYHVNQVFVSRHKLVGDDGQPLELSLVRLRKTHIAERHRATGGQLDQVALDHSKSVSAKHYGDIAALRETHESTIAAGLTAAYDAAMHCTVVTPAEETLLRENRAEVSETLRLTNEQVSPLLCGDHDLAMAACLDFHDSPFGSKGEACPSPFWLCLRCRNAVITSRHLPSILIFLDKIVGDRELLPADEWTTKWGAEHLAITCDIIPRFPEQVIIEARAVAEGDTPLLYLPPEALVHKEHEY